MRGEEKGERREGVAKRGWREREWEERGEEGGREGEEMRRGIREIGRQGERERSKSWQIRRGREASIGN